MRPGHQRRLFFAVLLLAGIGAGCSMVAAADQQTTLRVIMADDWASAPVVTEVIEEFEREHGNVTVALQPSPFSQIPDLVAGAIAQGEPHDLAHWHAFAAAASNLAEPLDDLWSEAGLTPEEYLPGALEGVTWQGQRFGVPLDTNALVLLVNEDAVSDADRASLGTLDGFRSAVANVGAADDVSHALAVSSSSWAAYGWIVAHGGSLVDIDERGVPTFGFEHPGTIDALTLMVELVRDGYSPRPFAPDLAADAVQAFSSGDSAMHTSGSWDLPLTWRAPSTSIDAETVSVLPLPQAQPDAPRTVLGGSSLFVPAGSQERDLAFELMLRLTADDVALRLVQEEGRLPARQRVLEDESIAGSPELSQFVSQLEYAEVMGLIAYPEVAAAFREGFEDVLSERRSPAEAMEQVQHFAEKWLAEGGG